MFEFINTILLRFRSCFSRQAAFHWFVILIVGFLVRSDKLGVTSVIRDLAILVFSTFFVQILGEMKSFYPRG